MNKNLLKKIETDLGNKVISHTTLGQGQCNIVYKIQTSTQTLCAKVEKPDKPFDELNHISVEGAILQMLNQNEKVMPYVSRHVVTAKNYYMYQYVDGLAMRDVFFDLSANTQNVICKDIASFHFLLKNLSKQQMLDIGVTQYDPNKHKLALDQHDLSALSSAHRKVIHTAYNIYLSSLSDAQPQLLHNDAHDQNIFIADKRAVFIDFGDMIWRDVHYEFYNYVATYPNHWQAIVACFETLSGVTLNHKRIISISLLRYLRGTLAQLTDPKQEGRAIDRLDYFVDILKG